MSRKTLILLIGVALLVSAAAAALAYVTARKLVAPAGSSDRVSCTMEVRQCPDGSSVGRRGPKCEFAPCSSLSPTPTPATTCGPDQGACQSGYSCIQRCGPPVVRVDTPPPTWYCEADAIAAKPGRCPICLAEGTRIGAPNGDVRVQDLRIGDRVWSIGQDGKKISSRVTAVARTPVPKTHRVVHLVLDDHRELRVSPDHPTAAGTRVGDLHLGDRYDGARVAKAELVPYESDATYDLLPDGGTGLYWADGILMGSTLKDR